MLIPKNVRGFGGTLSQHFLCVPLTFSDSSDIMRTDVLISAESTWLQGEQNIRREVEMMTKKELLSRYRAAVIELEELRR